MGRAEIRRKQRALSKLEQQTSIESIKARSINTTITMTMAVALFILSHEFDFKRKDIRKFLTEFQKGFDYMNRGYIKLDEFISDVKKKTGVDCREIS